MNMLAKVEPWDQVAQGYAARAGDLFRAHAREALSHAQVTRGMHVADIACGPGTLTTFLADQGAKVAAVDFSREMLAMLQQNLSERGTHGVMVHEADGQDLPFSDNTFDASFSLFGLMFFPDRSKGFAEMFRTLRSGGWAYVSSWSKMSDSPLFMVMSEVLQRLELTRSAPSYDVASLENPDLLVSEMTVAGFEQVNIHKLEHVSTFATAEELWESLVAASAPVSVIKSRMSDETWRTKSEDALTFIRANAGPFPAQLGTKAWLGTGRKPGDRSVQS